MNLKANKISIVIPVFNIEEYLPRCIDSILTQDYENFELILINDGSTDHSGDICDNYSLRDKRINVFHQKNEGVSSARNLGIEKATGEWICFVDGDDEIAANSLSKISLFLNEFSQLEILVLNSVKRKSTSKHLKMYPFPKPIKGEFWTGVELFKSGYLRGSVCGVVFKNSFLKLHSIGFIENIKNGEDSLFMTVCFIHAQIVRHLDLNFYLINEIEGSASKSWTYERILSMIRSLNAVHEYLNIDLSDDQKAMLNIKAYGIISNAFYAYSKSKKHPNGLKTINEICKRSGMYPIKTYGCSHFKQKIILMNFSLSMFYYTLVIRHKFDRLIGLLKV